MFAGFGTAEETNARFHYLLEQGQTGLSIAFDLPTLMGYDTDAPEALGEFGKCGVAISSLRGHGDPARRHPARPGLDLHDDQLAGGHHLGHVHRRRREAGRAGHDQLRGTLQNDILKEYIAQKEFIFPPEPSMRLVVDTIEFGTQHVPQWNTISISGYHIREAGSTAAQELAFTLADGIEYVRWAPAARPGRRRLRAAPVLLLQRPQRLLRGDRQVPRRAPHLGAARCATASAPRTRARG